MMITYVLMKLWLIVTSCERQQLPACYSEFEWEANDPGAVSTFTDIAPSLRYSYDYIVMPHGRTALSISSIIIIIGIQFLFVILLFPV